MLFDDGLVVSIENCEEVLFERISVDCKVVQGMYELVVLICFGIILEFGRLGRDECGLWFLCGFCSSWDFLLRIDIV